MTTRKELNKQFKSFIIGSAFLSSNPWGVNEALHNKTIDNLRKTLGHHRVIDVMGVYKGLEEKSILILDVNRDETKLLENIFLDTLKQESILFQDTDRIASLVFNNLTVERLGKIRAVPREDC